MKLVRISAAGCAVAGLMSSIAVAQQASNTARATGWFKTCDDVETRKVCNVQYRITAPNGANITTLNLVEIGGDNPRRVFQIIVPTARSLPPGIQVRVDEKRATSIPYLYCRPQACYAEVRLDEELVGVFKRGGKLDVTTINFQGRQNPVPVTLKGFTAAYDGPPVKREEPEERQQNLADQLQKKAEEERAKQGSGSE